MATNQASVIKITENQKKKLTQIQAGTHSPLHLKLRSEIILLASEGNSNNTIERTMQISGETVTQWRNRYAQAGKELALIESENPRNLRASIEKVLSDEPRSGKPPTFTDEQVACIIAVSCQSPEELGLPFSHWTSSSLRDEVIKRGIVSSISAMQIGRFLKRERSKTTSS
jgi:transposase